MKCESFSFATGQKQDNELGLNFRFFDRLDDMHLRNWSLVLCSREAPMNITLHIPDSIARSLRIPEGEAEQRLRQELAVALYAQSLLSFGKASELAEQDRFRFADVVSQHGIARHYGPEELAEDVAYADGQ